MINIYEKTIREAELDGCVEIEESAACLDAHLDDYIARIEDLLEQQGFTVEIFCNENNGKCYWCDTDDEFEATHNLPSFWEWYN